ncbi:MAG: biotin/lipoyl-containing protein, partial [Parvularculaceae bacterium]
MATEIRVPALGESVTEATIARWLKKEGEAVAADEPLVELETDKVSVEVPAPVAGVLSQIAAKEGDTVEVGALLGMVGGAGAVKPAPAKVEKSGNGAAKAEMKVEQPKAAPASAAPGADKPLSPAPRRVVGEYGLDPDAIEGTGKEGRITKGDARAAAREGAQAKPAAAPAKAKAPEAPRAPRDLGVREERVKMTRLRQTIARRLKEAQETAAMLTTFNDVDMSA